MDRRKVTRSNTAKLVPDLLAYLQLHLEIKPKVADRFFSLNIFRDRKNCKLHLYQPSYAVSIFKAVSHSHPSSH